MTTTKPHPNFSDRWIVKPSGCWEWQGSLGRGGYGQFYDGSATRKAHRYALEIATGVTPHRRLFACHSCDNRLCVNPAHLFWGTPADNSADMVAKGRSSAGRERTRKLTPEMKAEAVARQARGETYRAIGARFGVSGCAIHNVVRKAREQGAQAVLQ